MSIAWGEQGDILDMIESHPSVVGENEIETVVRAIVADGKAHGGFVSRNRVRRALANPSGELAVYHKNVGAGYLRAKTLGLIAASSDPMHVEVNDDSSKRGRNAGKLSRGLVLTDEGWAQ